MKLRFEIEGKIVELGSTVISHRMNNPMFEDVGSYSLPFTIPATNYNKSILNRNTRTYSATVFIGAWPIYGAYIMETSDDDIFEGYFTTGNSVFRSKVDGVLLSDLSHTEIIPGSASLSFTEALTAAANSSFPTYNYTCFPMLNPEYYNEDPFTRHQVINAWTFDPENTDADRFWNFHSLDVERLFAPSFYLVFVLQRLFSEYGYSIESNAILDDTELKTLVIPNMNTKGPLSSTMQNYELSFEDALPPVEINKFISAIEDAFNLTVFISDISRTVHIVKNTGIVKSQAEKKLTLQKRVHNIEEKADGYSLAFEKPSGDSFYNIADTDNYSLGLSVFNKEDISYYPASSFKNQLCKVVNNDIYYLSKLTNSKPETWEWEYLGKDYQDGKNGKGDFQRSIGFAPVLTDNDYIYDLNTPGPQEFALLPKVEVSCYNSADMQEYRTFESLRLLFYRGIVTAGGDILDPNDQVATYPLASPDVYKAKGQIGPARYGRDKIPSANQALKWDGQYGLYETHYKDYIYWYSNIRKSATDQYLLSLEEILAIQFWKKYQAGNQSVLIRSMNLKLDFTNNQVILEDCDVFLS